MQVNKYILWILVVFLITLQTTFATNETTKLKQLVNKISAVKTDINQTQQQENTVQQQLKITETHIGNVDIAYHQTQQNLNKQHTVLKKLSTNQEKYQQQLQQTQQNLNTQIRAAYLMGKQEYFKVLLNQEDPTKFSRMICYHNYIMQSRLRLLNKTHSLIKDIKHNKQNIQQQASVLQKLQTQQQNQRSQLQKDKQLRTQIAQKLQNKIQSQNEKLKKLLADKENLEKIITRLSVEKKGAGPKPSMVQVCNKFVWPTAGAIAMHFGSNIEQSQWQWTGILIDANEGQEVHSIANGVVAYADWLSGYGLLLIIDHGHGYLSIYGRNHSIYKKVGTTVQAGELVSTVGRSGGFDKPALYFAIRYNGKPVDPEHWCKKIS